MSQDKLYLEYILYCIKKIERFTSGGKKDFLTNELITDAVLRNLQIMAESTQKLSDETKSASNNISWNSLSGFRNVLVHAYIDINLDRVWQSIEDDLPLLKRFILTALENYRD